MRPFAAALLMFTLGACGFVPPSTQTWTTTKTVEVAVEVEVPFTPPECGAAILLLKQAVSHTADAGVASLEFDDRAFLVAISQAKQALRKALRLEDGCLG